MGVLKLPLAGGSLVWTLDPLAVHPPQGGCQHWSPYDGGCCTTTAAPVQTRTGAFVTGRASVPHLYASGMLPCPGDATDRAVWVTLTVGVWLAQLAAHGEWEGLQQNA